MPVITIRGHYGSYYRDIARDVAQRLVVTPLDHEILEEVARTLRVPVDEVERLEQVPVKLRSRILRAVANALERSWGMGTPEMFVGPIGYAPYYDHLSIPVDKAAYVKAMEDAVHDLATDDTVVFTKKGTQVLLKNHQTAIHVFVTAPLELRVKRVMEMDGLAENEARARIAHIDAQRKAYVKKYFKVNVEDLRLYDLVINTGKTPKELAVMIILLCSSSFAAKENL